MYAYEIQLRTHTSNDNTAEHTNRNRTKQITAVCSHGPLLTVRHSDLFFPDRYKVGTAFLAVNDFAILLAPLSYTKRKKKRARPP